MWKALLTDHLILPKGHFLTEGEEAKVDMAEERLENYLSKGRPGQDPDHYFSIRVTGFNAPEAEDNQGHMGCTGH